MEIRTCRNCGEDVVRSYCDKTTWIHRSSLITRCWLHAAPTDEKGEKIGVDPTYIENQQKHENFTRMMGGGKA